jgi:hypothetical protein
MLKVPFVFGHIQPLDSITPPTANALHFTEFFAKPEELARQSFIANHAPFLDNIYDHERTSGIPLYPKERRQDIEITVF